MKTALIIFALTITQTPKTLKLTNIYSNFVPSTVDSVNILAEKDNAYYVTRNGDLYGVYPKNSYRIEVVE